MSTENKYNLSVNHNNNIFLTMGYYVLKPIIEVYLDSRLDNKNVFAGIRSQKFYDRMIKKIPLKVGEGKGIICGQKIKINLSGNDIKNQLDLEYKVGTNKLPILNIAPLGMKKGEISVIHIPGYLIDTLLSENEENKQNIGISIEILDVLDDYPDEIDHIQFFTDESNNKVAKMCGDMINLSYTVLDTTGRSLYSDKINFKIGERKVPIGLEFASIGLQPEVNRTVILNGNLINKEYNEDLKILKIYLEE
jgi:hypothetical protein